MDSNCKILKFDWRSNIVELKVDIDKCTLLDIVVEFEDEAKKKCIKLDYHYPLFSYVFDMKHNYLKADKDLMLMFKRLSAKDVILIWVGTSLKPNALNKLVLNLKRNAEKEKKTGPSVDDLPSLDDLEDTSAEPTKSRPPISQTKASAKGKKPQNIPKQKKMTGNVIQPPPPISPKTAFQSLTSRRSPKFSPPQTNAFIAPIVKSSLFNRKLPKTTAIRKGLCTAESVVDLGEAASGSRSVKRKVEYHDEAEIVVDDEFEIDENLLQAKGDEVVDSDEEVRLDGDIHADEDEAIKKVPKVKENWKPGKWHDFIDDDDDDDYYQTLYKNGELYEDKEFGKIVLRPWMIFLDKGHFKDTLKDYCVHEGFAINVLNADNTRYTATCYAECCTECRNYKKQFPGPFMYTLFWRASNATNQFTYRKAIERLQKAGGDSVMTWLGKIGDPCTWSKHKFDPNVCNDSNTSNFVESFNSTLGVDRCRPVLTLLGGIRRVCMVRIATRQQIAMTWNDEDLCPKIVKVVKEISKGTISCKAYMSKPGEYEIHEGKSQFPLSLNTKLCSCGAWQLSGIPCRHAIRAMVHAKIDPHKVVSSWYSVRTYKHAYGFNINPIPDQENWPTYDGIPTIMPPTMKRGVGRPSRNRRREEGEDEKGKRTKTVKCKNCNHFGHNSRTCKGGPTEKEMQAAAPKLVRNPRIRDQSNAAKAAKAAGKAPAKTAGKAPAKTPAKTVKEATNAVKDAAKTTEKPTTSRKRKNGTQGSASQPSIVTASQSQQQN